MAIKTILEPDVSQEAEAPKRVIVEKPEEIPEGAKRSGVYLYIDTNTAGIKKVVSKQGGYLAFLDYGRKYKVDKKTGALVLKQEKTVKHVDTEKEAKMLRAEADAIRNGESVYQGKPNNAIFLSAVEDFKQSTRYLELNANYKLHGDNFLRHAIAYFANEEPKKISITDMESYYKYLFEHGNRMPKKEYRKYKHTEGLSISTVGKHRTFLKKVWEFFIDSGKFGVKVNVAERAKLPKVEIVIDGKTQKITREPYTPRSYTLDELNYTLNDIVQNEFDRSLLVAVGLAAIGSLRHSETIGLRFEKYYHNEYMNVSDDAYEYSGFDKEYYESHDNLMFIDTAIMNLSGANKENLPKKGRIRVAAVPDCLKKIIDYAMEQRLEIYKITGKVPDGKEPIYKPLINVIKGNDMKADKLSRKWENYQARRTKRMEKAGLKPIPEVRYHDLRHTFSNLCKITVPSWEISCNMGHVIPDGNTTQKVYWNDRQPYREDIIKYFDSHINIDWDKAVKNKINEDGCRLSVNGSGHLVVSKDEIDERKKEKRKFVFTEEELEKMFLPRDRVESVPKEHVLLMNVLEDRLEIVNEID